MNERTYLDRQQSRLNRRIRQRATRVSRDVEQAVTPAMREHPRTGLAAGAAAGALLGAALAPRRAVAATAKSGPLGSTFGFFKGVLAYALRIKFARSLVDEFTEPTSAESSEDSA